MIHGVGLCSAEPERPRSSALPPLTAGWRHVPEGGSSSGARGAVLLSLYTSDERERSLRVPVGNPDDCARRGAEGRHVPAEADAHSCERP